uniref:F-box domain-containing protein n=1 Tax=Oryza punctata TaxID=4537 RepID=A0A0E0JE96_ORYPU
MESTTREAKKLRRNPSDSDHGGGGGGNDLISHLSDDILVHILASLPNMTDVMRACAVSRRWRHLEARVPVLRFFFLDYNFNDREKLDQFIAFVNNILARRAHKSDATVEELEISLKLFNSKRSVPSVDVARVDAWIQYAMQHVLKSFTVQFDCHMLPLNFSNSNNGMVFDKLTTTSSSTSRLESMVLSLHKACLRLPTNVTFDSLIHLSLENVRFEDDCSSQQQLDLNQLLSPACCPSLRKLRLCRLIVSPPTKLHLESNELLELSLDGIWKRALELELKTPKLRVFHTSYMSIERLVISAPRLEELTFFHTTVASIVEVEDMPCVWSFETELRSMREPDLNDRVNRTRIRLLQCCKFLQFLTLHLIITQKDGHDNAEVDLIKDIPQLPQVTSLSLQVSAFTEVYDIDSVLCLLTRCKFLKHLELNIQYSTMAEDCKRPTGIVGDQNQRDHHIISLEHLQDIKITSAYRRYYESRLLKFLHASAPALKKMIFISAFMLSWNLQVRKKQCEEFLHSIALGKEGEWAFCYHDAHVQNITAFEWTPIKKVECREIVHMD